MKVNSLVLTFVVVVVVCAWSNNHCDAQTASNLPHILGGVEAERTRCYDAVSRLAKKYPNKKSNEFVEGASLYGEARADFNGLLTSLKEEIIQNNLKRADFADQYEEQTKNAVRQSHRFVDYVASGYGARDLNQMLEIALKTSIPILSEINSLSKAFQNSEDAKEKEALLKELRRLKFDSVDDVLDRNR